jgi:hypothetical protein
MPVPTLDPSASFSAWQLHADAMARAAIDLGSLVHVALTSGLAIASFALGVVVVTTALRGRS